MSNLSTLKQKVEEMQAEIERLEAEEREPKIPVGTLCWLWDDLCDESPALGILTCSDADGYSALNDNGKLDKWQNARIANDIPGVMVFEKHDGGPCPVDKQGLVCVKYDSGAYNSGRAANISWRSITAYAIINKAEWME